MMGERCRYQTCVGFAHACMCGAKSLGLAILGSDLSP